MSVEKGHCRNKSYRRNYELIYWYIQKCKSYVYQKALENIRWNGKSKKFVQ